MSTTTPRKPTTTTGREDAPRRTLLTRDVAAMLGVTTRVVRGLIERGRLPALWLSKRTIVVRVEDVEALLHAEPKNPCRRAAEAASSKESR